jgi:HlyD family secretion protein
MPPSSESSSSTVLPSAGASLRDVVEAEARKATQRRIVRWAVLALVVGGTAAATYALRPKPIAVSAKFKTEKLSRGDVVHHVSATGRLESRRTVEVGAEISGRIASVEVDFSDRVTQGQVLLRFRPESLRAQVAQVSAQLHAAQAALAQAEIDTREGERLLRQATLLVAAGANAANQRDALEAQVQAAKARIQAASAQVELQKASYELARTNLEHTVVRSPISGVVISRNVEPGQTVAAALQSPVLFLLAEDLREMRVLVSIDEADVGTVKLGQAASFTVDAYPTKTFEAVVHEIRSAPVVTQGVVTYEAVLFVENAALELKPGMTASVKIKTESASAVLRAPNAALRFIPPDVPPGQSKSRVWVVSESGPRSIAAQPGVSDGTYTAVEGTGLADGASVIVDLTPVGRKAYGLDDKRK